MASNNVDVRIKGRDESKGAFASATRSAKKFGASAARVTVGVGAVVGALGALAAKSLDAADKIHKLGQRSGASAKFLSEMRLAAELSGVSMETVANGLKKMQKSAADAAGGLSTPKKAFEALGISVDSFMKMKPADQFSLLADKLSAVENPTKRTQIAMDIMGRSGSELLSVMADGSDGIRAMREEAEKLGMSLSQDQVESAAAANDAWTRLTSATSSFVEKVVVDLAPALANVIDLLSAFLGLSQKFDGFFTAQGNLGKALEATEQRMKAIREEMQHLDPQTEAGIARLKTLGEEYNRLDVGMRKSIKAIDEQNKKETELNKTTEKTSKSLDTLAIVQDKAASKTKVAKTTMEKYAESLKSAQEEIDTMIDKEMLAHEMWEKGSIGIEVYGKKMEDLGHTANDAADTIAAGADKTEDAWTGTTNVIGQAWDGLWNGTAINSFSDFTKSIFASFKNLIVGLIKQWAAAKISKLFGFGGGASGGGIGGSLLSSAGSGIMSKLTGGLGSLFGGGGAVAGGGLLGPSVGAAGGGAGGLGGLATLGEKIATGFKTATSSITGASTSLGALAGYAGAAYVAFETITTLLTDSPMEIAIKQTKQEFSALNEQMLVGGQHMQELGHGVTAFGEANNAVWTGLDAAMNNVIIGTGEAARTQMEVLEQAFMNAGIQAQFFGNEGGKAMYKLTGNIGMAKQIMSQFGQEGQSAMSSVVKFTDLSTGAYQNLKEKVESMGGTINNVRGEWGEYSGQVTGSIGLMIALQNAFGSALSSSVGTANSLADAIGSIPSPPSVPSGGGVPKFAHGGSFTVGGTGGTDKNFIGFMATKGERVSIETPEQQKSGGLSGEAATLLEQIRDAILATGGAQTDALRNAAIMAGGYARS